MGNHRGSYRFMVVMVVLFSLVFIAWGVTRTVKDIIFDRNCEGYLKRAGDSNRIEMAAKQLDVAIPYMEKRKLFGGYTSVVYQTPDEDVGFWYDNIKEARAELDRITPESTLLERSNTLMKLRETLLDQGAGLSVTYPPGISIFPNNTAYAMWCLVSLILTLAFTLGAIVEHERY